MSARDVIASLSGSWFDIDVHGEGGEHIQGRYFVEPCTTHRALTLMATLAGAVEGNASEERRLLQELTDWLPKPVFRGLFELGRPAQDSVRDVMALLRHGAPASYESDLKQAADGAMERSWMAVLADYRHAYGSNPLQEPWHWFLSQNAELVRIRKVSVYDFIEGYVTARAGKQHLMDQLVADAFPELKSRLNSGVEDISDEHLAEQLKVAAAFRQTRGKA